MKANKIPVSGTPNRETGSADNLNSENTERFVDQATSLKPQAQRFKLQAASVKLPDRGPWRTFPGPRTEALDQDKTILRMCHMEGNLVWRKCHTITSCYFQFNCKKEMIFIISPQIWRAKSA